MLDYKGFRFRNIDQLCWAFRVEEIGGPEKLLVVAGQNWLEVTVGLVEKCCKEAARSDLDNWRDGAWTTLKEMMGYCCRCHPAYLIALRGDTLLLIVELHRERLMNFTPSTCDSTTLCTRLQAITTATSAPLPLWTVCQQKTGHVKRGVIAMSIAD